MTILTRARGAGIALLLILTLLPFTAVQAQTTAGANVTEFDVNGMKVLIKRRPGTPTVAAGLFIRGGVANTTAENAGIENFTLSSSVEGSKSYPRQRLRKETTRAGTVISAGATYDYSAISMASTKGSFEDSWKIFVDVAINPLFDPDSVERIRQNILTGLRSESDSPEGTMEAANNRIIYAGHPYANSPAGTTENITKFKVADLAAYHRSMMQTSRLLLVIVGDVEPTALQKRIAASFAGVPRGEYKDPVLPAVTFVKPSLEVIPRDVQTNYVTGTFAAPTLRDPDYYAMRTAMTILQTQVFQEVRVKRNLSYAPEASMGERAANTAQISVTSVDPNQSVSVMLDEIEKLKRGSVDEDTLGQMSGFFLTTHYIKQETNAAQAAELAQYELMGGGWRNSLEFLNRIRQVKPDDVRAAANKYMKNLRFVVVGKPADINKSIFVPAE
jgi:predicted Zn-dependent peptidase